MSELTTYIDARNFITQAQGDARYIQDPGCSPGQVIVATATGFACRDVIDAFSGL
jgi:hypothetical protein